MKHVIGCIDATFILFMHPTLCKKVPKLANYG